MGPHGFRGRVLEEHARRLAVGPHRGDQRGERAHEPLELRGRERRQAGQEALLRDARRAPEQLRAARGERDLAPAPVARRGRAPRQPGVDEALDDDRDRALVRRGGARQLADRLRAARVELVQDEELRAAHPEALLRGARRLAQDAHDAADRVHRGANRRIGGVPAGLS